MKKYAYLILFFLILAGGMGGEVALAQNPEAPPTIAGIGNTIPTGPQSGRDLFILVQTLTDWLFVAFILTAVVFIIIAAFQFLTGGGDPNSVAQARQRLIWAVVAIGLAILSRAIPVVANFIITAP
mgnify:CR=1 FL=1